MKKRLRIFISSPGDVKLERGIAKRVINELQSIYREYIKLEVLMWEDLPLEATNSFQGGIDYFLEQAPIDIAVFILWSRLGSTLGHTYRRTDGSVYASGTEYEFDTMYTLWLQTQKPKIMVYVKDSDPQFSNGMSSLAIREALEQQDMLHSFIDEKFHDAETNTNYAYWQFDKQQTFEERLRTHLSKLIKDAIGQDVYIREWEGNPYVGLKSYSFEESKIYCGRKDLIYETAEKLMLADAYGKRSPLFVLGESGSGKSSFIRAGLLPHLLNYGNETNNNVKEILPSAFHGEIYDGIVDYIVKSFPILGNNPVLEDLHNGINVGYNFKHLKYAIDSAYKDVELILFFDQLEEIFSDSLITEEERLRTFLLLKGLSEINSIQLIFSMRSDFYDRFTRYPDFGYIKNSSAVVDIPKVSFEDITEIVEIPAQKANLKWEINDKGIKLSKQIAKEAFELGQLPLIEFGLSELYNACKYTEILTYEAYNNIGTLKGAVIKYADKLYDSFTDEEKKIFANLLSAVITISDKDEMIFVRKTTLRKNIERDAIHKKLLDKLIDSHLFISGKDSCGEATITIVHEMLIHSWTVVKEWCQSQISFLKQNDYYEKQARYWMANNKSDKSLIQERSLLLEAEYFIFKYEQLLAPFTYEFISKSLKKQRRKGLVKHCFIFFGLLITLFFTNLVVWLEIPVDPDMNEWFGIEDISLYELISMSLMFLLISGQAVWLRLAGKPEYKTVKRSSIIWGAITIYTFIDALVNILSNEADGFALVMPIVLLMIGSSVWIEYYRRNLWNRSIFKPYIISDKFSVVKNIIVYSIITIMTLAIFVGYVGVLNEKNESLETTITVADELFEGFNNISSQLSPVDKINLYTKRLNYIKERFPDELQDTIPDDREYQYATCLYNLHNPIASNSYLTYFYDSKGFFLNILNYAMMGDYSEAARFLEAYVNSECFDELGEKNTGNLIWVAECAGRFDLAERLYKIIEDNGVDWRNQSGSYWVNYGHIHLMNGDYKTAAKCYDYAPEIEKRNNTALKTKYVKDFMESNIKNDMLLFEWLGIGGEIPKQVMARRGYPRRKFYTHISDTLQTRRFREAVAGSWILSDSTITMTYHETRPICNYSWYRNGEEVGRSLTSYRCSYRDGHSYIEEYDSETGVISTGEIVHLDEKTLELLIIENGSADDNGTTRRYTKME